jgi:Ala-tRNA(Pro) deacylase
MAISASIEHFLGDNRIPYAVLPHPRAYTAQREAAVTHVPGRMWAKTVACFADNDPILAVLPADSVIDVDRLRMLTGARALRFATEDEIGQLYTDCELGAMPPLGVLYGQRVFVDRSLADDDDVVFNGGSHTDAIKVKYQDFDRLVHPVVGDFGSFAGGRSLTA